MPTRGSERLEQAPLVVGLVSPLPPQVGGVASFAGWLLAREDDLGVRYVSFDLWRPPGREAGGRLTAGALVVQLRLLGRFLGWLPRSPRLVHYCVSYTTTGTLRDLLFVTLLRLSRKRVIGHVHGGDLGFDSARAPRSRLLRAIGRLCRERVAISAGGSQALSALGLESRWIVNPLRLEPDGAGLDRGHDGDGCRLLFVGTYGERKGSSQLLDAVARTRADGLDVRLSLVGQEERSGEEQALRTRIRELGLDAHVEILPPVPAEELARHYAAADAFCLPSRREGLPMALLEAMAFGLPVVASRVGGIPEVVDDASGLLVEPGDVAALTAAIGRLASDPALRARLGNAARERVHVQAGPAVVAARWRALYRELGRDEATDRVERPEVTTCA